MEASSRVPPGASYSYTFCCPTGCLPHGAALHRPASGQSYHPGNCPYGTITYTYDAENRLLKTCGSGGVGVEYAYDNNGNLLSQTSSLKHSIYEYNPQNRMVRSRVVDDEARTIASTRYGYDVLGRRTLVQDSNATTLRTLYDGLGFDVVKESPVYSSGGFVDTYNTGIQYTSSGRATGERYRYLDDGQGTSEKYQYIEDNEYQTVSSRYAGERSMLYAHGSPVAVNRAGGTRGYLGTDILGSTRSVTDNHGVQESFYDYDIFGSPITGDYTTGTDYGYLGKPYDSITGLYNYGYRDYSPQTVRFTTVDPIRDGSNWFAYVNNDPVNYVDLWGLLASEGHINWNAVLDGVQAGLDVAGLVPGVGEIADGVNALISLVRGDVAGATLSATSMLPIVGDAIGKGGKIARAAIKHGDEVLEAETKLLGKANNTSKIEYSDEFLEWLNKGDSNNMVYFGQLDDGSIVYTGITKQTLNDRLTQHQRQGKEFVDLLPQHENLTRNQARALEQYYIENGPNRQNKINSISSNNRFYDEAKQWASNYNSTGVNK